MVRSQESSRSAAAGRSTSPPVMATTMPGRMKNHEGEVFQKSWQA